MMTWRVERSMDDKSGKPAIEYGIVPIDVMASMSGLDFVRAIFARRLPEPPIMQTVEPFDCTVEPGAVVIHSVPGLRHYNPIGSVHGGYAAILLDSAMGLAVQSTLPAGIAGSQITYGGLANVGGKNVWTNGEFDFRGSDFSVRALQQKNLAAVRKKFRRAAFSRFNVREFVTKNAVIRLAKRRERK